MCVALGAHTAYVYSRCVPPPPPPPAKPKLKLSLQEKQPAPGPDPTAQTPHPPSGASYTNVAVTAVDPEAEKTFTVVTHKRPKQQKKKGLLRPLYNPNDQKVVHPGTPPQPSVQMTWQYLQMANRAVREYQKDLDYCLIRCYVMMKQNLVLQISTKTRGPDYLSYLEAIKTRLEEEGKLQVTAIDGEPRWSTFLLHGVPTTATMDEGLSPSRNPTREFSSSPKLSTGSLLSPNACQQPKASVL